ncbi:MAG TPA: transketolase [Armatimonadota bacterium]|jgi:transketolase
MDRPSAAQLKAIANQLRIHSITSTTAAGSGHPTSSMSAADIVAALFFGVMRYDPTQGRKPENDRFILSKGHAAPILYGAWAEAGIVSVDDLKCLRKLDCDLEGHPTPRLPFVDVATGSLGQGLAVGVGEAIACRLDGLDARTYVLMGDGEAAEGSVWEAANLAAIEKLDSLVAIIDVNALGQSMETAFGHHTEVYRKRFEAFGWHAIEIDGHDMEQVLRAFDEAAATKGKPTAIVARTEKGAGVSFLAGASGWHGKALKADEAERAIAELQPHAASAKGVTIPAPTGPAPKVPAAEAASPATYELGKLVATREAFGFALKRLAKAYPRLVVLDGDTQNSTFTEYFGKENPARFVECYIAEQNLVGVAAGLAARGKIPVAATFACFLSRAFDQIRMAGISQSNLKLCGSHVGVSIGEDGGSQMGLEDLSMMRSVFGSVVLYPADAVAAEKLTEEMLKHQGIAYLRTSRPKTAVLYESSEEFPIGGSKVLRQSDKDVVTVVAAGVTLYETLKAFDELAKEGIAIQVVDAYSVKPLDAEGIGRAAARTSNQVITVEDHYAEGGLGDAVAGELSKQGVRVHKLAVHELPHSGTPDELVDRYGISARHIVEAVKAVAR